MFSVFPEGRRTGVLHDLELDRPPIVGVVAKARSLEHAALLAGLDQFLDHVETHQFAHDALVRVPDDGLTAILLDHAASPGAGGQLKVDAMEGQQGHHGHDQHRHRYVRDGHGCHDDWSGRFVWLSWRV
jgi:hypothetical protein